MSTCSPGLRCRYDGVVDSVGFGVQPDSTLVGTFTSTGLPDVQRSLNWVHLATRFPVRVRINAPETEPFRLSESAVVVIRGDESEIAMAAQGKALPAVSQPSAIDEAGKWFWNFLKNELAPYPGRAWVVGRVTISATIVMVLVMTFQHSHRLSGRDLYPLPQPGKSHGDPRRRASDDCCFPVGHGLHRCSAPRCWSTIR